MLSQKSKRFPLWFLTLILAAAVIQSARPLHAASNPNELAVTTSLDSAVGHAAESHAAVASKTQIEPTYKIEVGLQNEIYPVFANHAALQAKSDRTWGTFAVAITNSSDSILHNRVTVEVPGWSDREIQMVRLAAGEARTLLFAPTFLPRLYLNKEIAAATVEVHVTDMSGTTVFAETAPVRLRAADDMYWGDGFKFAPFVASWVTPHDPNVELVLSRAKEFAPNRRLPGYEEWKGAEGQGLETAIEARAIYRAVQAKGVSYVKSSLTFGGNAKVSERIRLPRESLRESSANCIDGAVMYASLFENLGMDSALVLVPGHAYVGVRTAHNSSNYLYFDTALTGRADFNAAIAAAERGLARYPKSQIITIRVDDARNAGIFPMPETGEVDNSSLAVSGVPGLPQLKASHASMAAPR